MADRTRGLCVLCHVVPGAGGGDLGPPLAGVGSRLGAAELRQRIVDPRALNPDTIMPGYGKADGLERVGAAWRGRPVLSTGEIEDVVAYLETLRD